MLWRYAKMQLWVLLCGGLVGPIFLAVYFATGQDSLMKWMFWTGLVVTAADVLIALALASYGAKASAKSADLEQHGVLATAQVIGIHETGTRINNHPLVKLDLHVEGPGIIAFTTQDRVIASVTRLPLITGRRLVALVDPATNAYEIDWNRSALVGGMLPAQFTLDEDNAHLRPVRSVRSAHGDHADPQGQQRPAVRDHRHPVQSGGASAGDERGQGGARIGGPRRETPPAPAAYPPPPPAPTGAGALDRAASSATRDIAGHRLDLHCEYSTKRQQIISEL